MNEILFSNEVIVYLLSETIIYGLLFLSFIVSLGILKSWNYENFNQKQFILENRSYLVESILFFTLILKVFLLPYFVYTIDNLSLLIPGAMCGAGVIEANSYGNPLLILKMIILFLSGLWFSINRLDLQKKSYPYLTIKLWLFVAIFFLLSIEYSLDIAYFTHIATETPVTCCSVLFSQVGGANGLPLGLTLAKLVWLFYLVYILLMLSIFLEKILLSVFTSALFAFIAYYAVVYFFGTYVYQLPTHNCPFCMLQSYYYYVGYLIWGLLFFSVYLIFNYGVMSYFFKTNFQKNKAMILSLLTAFVFVCSAYVILYYVRNGVFL